jgi:aryl-alcohol dehydrogenase-like predicted oxidoreductase
MIYCAYYMEYKTLGKTDIKVPTICLGTMTWGQQNTEEEAHEQLDYALEQGIYFIDTAEIYPIPPEKDKQGRTETYVGTWLAKQGAAKRSEIVLASKVASRVQAGSIGTRDASAGLTRESIRTAIDGSLKRLQTDYLDLYQVHSPDRPANFWGIRGVTSLPENAKEKNGTPIEETLDALSELVKEGKVRMIGVSNEHHGARWNGFVLQRKKVLSELFQFKISIRW